MQRQQRNLLKGLTFQTQNPAGKLRLWEIFQKKGNCQITQHSRYVQLFQYNTTKYPESVQQQTCHSSQGLFLCLLPLNTGIIQSFKVKYRKKCACCVLTQITNDSDPSKIDIANDNLQAIEWVFEARKEIFNDINYLEKCGNKSSNEVDEKFVNLFKELTSEMQTDSEMTAEYFNFDGEGYTSSPVINSDKVNWRWTPIEASLNAYIFVGKVVRDNSSDGDSNDGNDHENLKVKLLVSLRQGYVVKFPTQVMRKTICRSLFPIRQLIRIFL